MSVASADRPAAASLASPAADTADTSSRRPRFRLDTKPFLKLPEGRTLGPIMCVDIGPDGHVWVLHSRRNALGLPDGPQERASRLPEVVEFDEDGAFLQAWGGPDHLPQIDGNPQWPQLEETIAVDSENGVWVFGSRKLHDHVAIRFSRDGELLLKIGRYGVTGGDESRDLLGCPTDVYLDAASREVFVSDGYVNRRVVSFNVDTGAFIRAWTAYGHSLPAAEDKGSSFHLVHSVGRGPEGHLYVCDRMNNRVQVFDVIGRKDVTFVRELEIAPGTLLYGSAAEVAFPPDGAYMYVADNSNFRIWIACLKSWQIIGWFAGNPAEGTGNSRADTYVPHRIVFDRDGNLLVARVAGGFERYIFEGVS